MHSFPPKFVTWSGTKTQTRKCETTQRHQICFIVLVDIFSAVYLISPKTTVTYRTISMAQVNLSVVPPAMHAYPSIIDRGWRSTATRSCLLWQGMVPM